VRNKSECRANLFGVGVDAKSKKMKLHPPLVYITAVVCYVPGQRLARVDLGQLSRELLPPAVGSNTDVGET